MKNHKTEIFLILEVLEERMKSLEKSIKNASNHGVKKVMQNSFVLNKSLHAYYKVIYANRTK